uniref:uncharacterized protein LOC120888594 n=1 Tax=Ictidomys tridecemlineatus TaxID=43179 RepID=UPI001A9E9E08|nr:uncharacterized protein LOC120888594 [Ictidomys tridecemlineatus]
MEKLAKDVRVPFLLNGTNELGPVLGLQWESRLRAQLSPSLFQVRNISTAGDGRVSCLPPTGPPGCPWSSAGPQLSLLPASLAATSLVHLRRAGEDQDRQWLLLLDPHPCGFLFFRFGCLEDQAFPEWILAYTTTSAKTQEKLTICKPQCKTGPGLCCPEPYVASQPPELWETNFFCVNQRIYATLVYSSKLTYMDSSKFLISCISSNLPATVSVLKMTSVRKKLWHLLVNGWSWKLLC